MINQETIDVPFILVVETNQYCVGFEHRLCAYVTGVIGDIREGGIEADQFETEVFDTRLAESVGNLITQVKTDFGYNPCSVWGWDHRSIAIFLKTWPAPEQIQLFVNRIKGYCRDITEGYLEVQKISIVKREVVINDKEIFNLLLQA